MLIERLKRGINCLNFENIKSLRKYPVLKAVLIVFLNFLNF